MIKQQDLENVVEDIAAKLFEQLYPNTKDWTPEKQAEEAMGTLELVAYVINNFMLELNKRFESVAEEVINEKETPKIYVP
jgi:hypothetical protein